MGYMGLSVYGESDSAFDAAWNAINAMVASLEDNLDNEAGNCYNTCGVVNVALFFETFIIPIEEYGHHTKLQRLAAKTIDRLESKIKHDKKLNWDSDENKKMHMDAYNRMVNSLKEWVEVDK